MLVGGTCGRKSRCVHFQSFLLICMVFIVATSQFSTSQIPLLSHVIILPKN